MEKYPLYKNKINYPKKTRNISKKIIRGIIKINQVYKDFKSKLSIAFYILVMNKYKIIIFPLLSL